MESTQTSVDVYKDSNAMLITGIEFDDKPFYFVTTTLLGSENAALGADDDESMPSFRGELGRDPEGHGSLPDCLQTSDVLSCAFLVPRDTDHEDFNRASYAHRLAKVREVLDAKFERKDCGTNIWLMHEHVQGDGSSFTSGFFVQIYDKDKHDNDIPEASTEDLVIEFARGHNLRLSFLDFGKASDTVWQKIDIVDLRMDGGATARRQAQPIRDVATPLCHPAFLRKENNSVFGSLSEVWEVLQKCPDLPGVPELQNIAQAELGEWLSDEHDGDANDQSDQSMQHPVKLPFVVVEGLDGTGKTTLVKHLASTLGATVMKTPPQCMMDLRPKFDGHPSLIRRLYYCIGNYIVSKNIADVCRTSPVIMDRFWNSTAGYTIASECAGGDESVLPPRGHQVYQWPDDLIRPNLVLLLIVSETERETRLSKRVVTERIAKTREEEMLTKNKLYQRKIVAAYRRMTNTSSVEMQGECTPEELAQNATRVVLINGLNDHGE